MNSRQRHLTTLVSGVVLLMAAAPGPAASVPPPTATHRSIATIAVGNEPVAVAVSPSGRRLYVANADSAELSVVSTARRKVIATVAVGWGPSGVAVSADGTRIYVANTDEDSGSGRVTVIDAATNQVLATPIVSGSPSDLVLHPAGTRLFVRDYNTGRTLALDLASGAVVAEIPNTQGQFAVSPDGTRLYAFQDSNPADYGPWELAAFDATTLGRLATATAVQGTHLALETSGARAFVTTASGISVVDTATMAVIGSVAPACPGCSYQGLAVSPSGPRLYAAVSNGSQAIRDLLVSISTESLGVVARAKVGEGVADVAVNAAGTRAYVANSDDNTVSVVNVTLFPPSQPRSVRVATSSGAATVTWKHPSHRGAGRVDLYSVVAVPGGQGCTTTRRSCTVTGLLPGIEYRFEVRAHNRDGWSRARASRLVLGM